MKKLLLACASFGLMAGGAQAQIIIGTGLGKECYNAAKFSSGPFATRERTCTEAIQSGSLNRRDLVATYVNRGIIRMRDKNYDDAQADYAAARRIDPEHGAIYVNQGVALISSGRHMEAIPVLKKALELDTQDPHIAHFNLGIAYDLNNQVNEAYYAFQAALNAKPEWDLALTELERYSVVSEG